MQNKDVDWLMPALSKKISKMSQTKLLLVRPTLSWVLNKLLNIILIVIWQSVS